MKHYYAKRAAEYECIYQKPERQPDLRRLRDRVSRSFSGRDLLEIACGTGYWTQVACRSARRIVAIDCSDEVLGIAQQKTYGDCPVTFVRDDAYSLREVGGGFSAALIAFWWSHMPKERIDAFLMTLHSRLVHDAIIVVIDNRYVEGSSTPISRTDDDGNTYQIRRLSDGSTHEVLKNFPRRQEVARRIAPMATEYSFSEMEYFWLAEYRVAEARSDFAE